MNSEPSGLGRSEPFADYPRRKKGNAVLGVTRPHLCRTKKLNEPSARAVSIRLAGRNDGKPSWCEDHKFMVHVKWACPMPTWSPGNLCRRARIHDISREKEPHSVGKDFGSLVPSLDESGLWKLLHIPKESVQPNSARSKRIL